MTALLTIFGLTTGAFVYEGFAAEDWRQALEHSFFMAAGVCAYALNKWRQHERL